MFTSLRFVETTPRLSHLNKDGLFKVLGDPIVEEFARLDGKPVGDNCPKQLVESTCWADWSDEDEEDIRIIDFGQTFLQGYEPRRLAQSGDWQVPEEILADAFDYRLDLWRAGIVVRTNPAEQI